LTKNSTQRHRDTEIFFQESKIKNLNLKILCISVPLCFILFGWHGLQAIHARSLHRSVAPLASQAAPPKTGLICRGDPSRPEIALTFDACQKGKRSGWDEAIFETLVREKVKATIFMGGKWMESHPDAAKKIGANPLFEIGNHSYSHPDFRKISAAKMKEEIRLTQEIQCRLIGRQGVVFRFPYARYSSSAISAVTQEGLYPIQFSVVTGDPDKHESAKTLRRVVVQRAHNGAIVIMHINGRGWHTAEALPGIIHDLSEKGFAFVTVREMLSLPDDRPCNAPSR